MKINYDIVHLKPLGQYKDRQTIDINGIHTMFMNGELQYLEELSDEDYATIKLWVVEELVPYMTRKTFNPKHSSYGLKHIAEREISEKLYGNRGSYYVCNAAIKYALSELGHEHSPISHCEINYFYKLSEDFYKKRKPTQ